MLTQIPPSLASHSYTCFLGGVAGKLRGGADGDRERDIAAQSPRCPGHLSVPPPQRLEYVSLCSFHYISTLNLLDESDCDSSSKKQRNYIIVSFQLLINMLDVLCDSYVNCMWGTESLQKQCGMQTGDGRGGAGPLPGTSGCQECSCLSASQWLRFGTLSCRRSVTSDVTSAVLSDRQ